MLKLKTNAQLFFLLLLVTIFVIGCATTNWTSRIGEYSYDQVVEELGEPTSSEKLENGDLLCKWLKTSYLTATPLGGGETKKGRKYYWKIFAFDSDGILKEAKEESKTEWEN